MEDKQSLWNFADKLPLVANEHQLSLYEGHTPLVEVEGIYFKREDLNPNGSIKDRGLCYQISVLVAKGHKKFTISSSGNAAISAAAYCQLADTELTVCVSPNVSQAKLDKLKKFKKVKVEITKRPVSTAHRYAKLTDAYNLRPSQDPLGSIGYQTIAYELQQQLSNVGAIFLPVSSATTLRGIAEGYRVIQIEDLHQSLRDEVEESSDSEISRGIINSPARNGRLPQLHAVQTSAVHSIAKNFDAGFTVTENSLASALVAKSTPQKVKAIKVIKRSEGSGWVVNDQIIREASKWLKDHHLETSYEGAAALGGYWKARDNGWMFNKPVVVLLTGSLN